MTPAQLRTYAAVVRNGASKPAAEELGVSEAAVSNHISALRKELDDRLFQRSRDGLVFTPGGLRLASRAVEMLGLQEQTKAEVHAAAAGQRLLRLAVSSLFGEYCAPGLIELFATRARDLRVEMAVHPPTSFADLLERRGADLALGPSMAGVSRTTPSIEFVRYQQVVVAARNHPAASVSLTKAAAASVDWLLGPSAIDVGGVANRTLVELEVPEARQLVYQSSEAALAAARAGDGVAFGLLHKVADEIKTGRLVALPMASGPMHGTWTIYSGEAHQLTPAAK